VQVKDYDAATAFDKDGKEVKHFKGVSDHFENFIKAVRSRNESQLRAPIREGHLSSALCHTSNISYRCGSQTSPDAMREQIKGDNEAAATFDRMGEHLAANGVNLNSTAGTLGAVLKMNPANESFMDNKKANHLLAIKPRDQFVIKLT
jgi:hypothetical protein